MDLKCISGIEIETSDNGRGIPVVLPPRLVLPHRSRHYQEPSPVYRGSGIVHHRKRTTDPCR